MAKNKEKKENINKRGKLFRERMKKKGYIRFSEWIPEVLKEKIRDFIKFLKECEND